MTDSVLITSWQQKWSTKHNVPRLWTRFTLNPKHNNIRCWLVFFFLTTSTFAVDVKVLPQLFSSELSTQSFTWSHLYLLGIHWPSWQVNWSDLHVCPPAGESFLLTLFSKKFYDSSQELCISSAYRRFFVHPSRQRSLPPHRRRTPRRCIPRLSHTWTPASCTMAMLPHAQNNKKVNS